MKPSNELIRKEPGVTAVDRPADSIGIPHSYNYGVDSNSESQVHLLDYWRAIRKRLWLGLNIMMLVTSPARGFLGRQPRLYPAHPRVYGDLQKIRCLVAHA